MLFFNARWLDVSTGRFAQADTLIPQGQGVQAWDRYAYANNSPVNYTDPSGHALDDGCRDYGCDFGTSSSTLSSSSYVPTPTAGSGGGNGCSGPNPSVVCLPTVPDLEFDITHVPTQLPPTVDYFYIQTTLPNACTASPRGGISMADALGGLRTLCGQIDPFIPGEFTGTNLGYIEAVQQAAQSLEAVLPGNPITTYAMPLVGAAPVACAAYDCVYDFSTESGEYYDAFSISTQNMSITPEGIIYTILAVLTLIPAIPPFP